MDIDDRLGVLTLAQRAELNGVTSREQHELERRWPCLAHWSMRYGHGPTNMRAWIAAGQPSADRDALCVSGLPAMIRAVREVVDLVPEPVAWHLVQSVAFACVPRNVGLTGPWPQPPPNPTTRIDIPFTDPALIAHEIGHAWHRDPRFFAGLTSAQIEAVDDAIADQAGAPERDERSDLRELAADAFASVLGWPIDTSNQRSARRQLFAREER